MRSSHTDEVTVSIMCVLSRGFAGGLFPGPMIAVYGPWESNRIPATVSPRAAACTGRARSPSANCLPTIRCTDFEKGVTALLTGRSESRWRRLAELHYRSYFNLELPTGAPVGRPAKHHAVTMARTKSKGYPRTHTQQSSSEPATICSRNAGRSQMAV